jgi:hypothetical protein
MVEFQACGGKQEKTKTTSAQAFSRLILLTAGMTTLLFAGPPARQVAIIGASVGYGWNVSEWPQRMQSPAYRIEMLPVYAFDKSEAITDLLMRPKRTFRLTRSYILGFFKTSHPKPQLVIIKECAAYFPGNVATYRAMVSRWVTQCRDAGVIVALATVVPVTSEHAKKKPGRIEGISQYNDFVRAYCAANKIPCLDLEKAVRLGDHERFLNPAFTSGDGLHINRTGYDKLDTALGRFFEKQGV